MVMDFNIKTTAIMGAAAAAFALGIVSLFMGNTPLFVNLLIVAIVIAVVPFSIVKFIGFRRTQRFEEEFPNFLRSVAEAQMAGLSTLQAIRAAAKSEYGSLTKEIIKLDKQISWNVPLETALSKFSKRTRSKLIERSVLVIIQANKSGGNVENIMNSLATNIEENRNVQEEKAALMSQQVMMMYAIFFIFLGICIALVKFLVPIMETQKEVGAAGVGGLFGGNPCLPCIDGGGPDCVSCNLFLAIGSAFEFGDIRDIATYYKALFFSMVMIQGLFSGLVAGQIASDSVTAGTKHSMIMMSSGLLVFMVVIKVGLI